MGTNEVKASSTNPPFEFGPCVRVAVYKTRKRGARYFDGMAEIRRVVEPRDNESVLAEVEFELGGDRYLRVIRAKEQRVKIPNTAIFVNGAICPCCDHSHTTYNFRTFEPERLHYLCGLCGHEETEAVAHG